MASTPCEISPEDWFIEKDGKQYRDDPILTEDEEQAIMAECEGRPFGEVEEAILDGEEKKTKVSLIRRRKARDACYECPVRTACLDTRLTRFPGVDGIWGGYFSQELSELDAALRRRGQVD